jgi:tRNA G18 (ribose-2'-O)-methylase SpoU
VPWEYRESVVEAIQDVKQRGIPVVALELTDQSRVIWDTEFPEPVALVLGNEALGVSQEVLDLADQIVEIPMMGYKNSINVSVAFGIVMYEIQRQQWDRITKLSWIRKGPPRNFESSSP